MSDWEPCPRCGSNRVQQRGALYAVLLGIGSLGCGIWLLIIPFIGIPLMLFGLVMLAISPAQHRMVQCQDCNNAWKPARNPSA